MRRFVLDASAAIACCLGEAEMEGLSASLLECLQEGLALVPAIWPSEVANVLVGRERRGLLQSEKTESFLGFLSRLPLYVDCPPIEHTFKSIVELARRHRLTIYDAQYLELAIRFQVPLATLDYKLQQSAKECGIELLESRS